MVQKSLAQPPGMVYKTMRTTVDGLEIPLTTTWDV